MKKALIHIFYLSIIFSGVAHSDENFFPIGIFSANPPTVLKELKDAGFNIVHTYEFDQDYLRKYLAQAEKVGIKTLVYPGTRFREDKFYSLEKLAKSVEELKESAAIAAWQLQDEPELNNDTPDDMKAMLETLHQKDPIHSAAIIINNVDHLQEFAPFTDVMMVDPYPIPGHPLTIVSDRIELARSAVKDQKPVWAILQAYGYQNQKYKGWGRDREPTFSEERCMTYLSVVHGAKGIFYYTYLGSQYYIELSPEHWKGIKQLAGELSELTPVLLAPVSTEKIQLNVADNLKDSNGAPAIHYLLKEKDGRHYLFAVNVLDGPVTATFTDVPAKESVQLMFEKRDIPVEKKSFTDFFKPYAVRIYVF